MIVRLILVKKPSGSAKNGRKSVMTAAILGVAFQVVALLQCLSEQNLSVIFSLHKLPLFQPFWKAIMGTILAKLMVIGVIFGGNVRNPCNSSSIFTFSLFLGHGISHGLTGKTKCFQIFNIVLKHLGLLSFLIGYWVQYLHFSVSCICDNFYFSTYSYFICFCCHCSLC